MSPNEKFKAQVDHILSEVAKTQNIKNYKLQPNITAHHGDGFLTQFITGEIINEDRGDIISVAIKKPPLWEYNYRIVFKTEISFYDHVFPALDRFQKEANVSKPFDNVPKYFCGSIAEEKEEYIAMENLKPDGYGMFDRTKFFDQDHLEYIFKTYGKFHALSFVLRKKNYKLYENTTNVIDDTSHLVADIVGPNITAAVSAAVSALDAEKYPILREELRDLGVNAVATFKNAFKYNGNYKCLVHGDCWSNNMLFKYSDSGKLLDIKLLDFQLIRDGTPIHDLSYLFYSGGSKKDFDNLDHYLRIYHKTFYEFAKELGANPDELFSFDVLVKEWKENALLGVIFGTWVWQLKLVPIDEYNELMQSVKGKPKEEAMVPVKAFWTKITQNNLFKENTASILNHAFEFGILNKGKIVIDKQQN